MKRFPWWARSVVLSFACGLPGTLLLFYLVSLLRAQPAPSIVGYVDRADCENFFGWAADLQRLNVSIAVDVYITSSTGQRSFIGSFPAGLLRSDVGSYLRDNGLHGFSITTAPGYAYWNGLPVQLEFLSAGRNLSGSPKTITCQPNPSPSWSITRFSLGAGLSGVGPVGDRPIEVSIDRTSVPFKSGFSSAPQKCVDLDLAKNNGTGYLCVDGAWKRITQ